MQHSKKISGLLIAGLLAAAGCADPAGVVPQRETENPAFDGIGWAGSGHRTPEDSTTSTATTTTSTESAPGIGWAGSGH